MVAIRFIARQPDGAATTHEVDAPAGQSLMQAAVAAGVQGIAADCGGMLVCGTCHVYVAPQWTGRLPAPSGEEEEVLGFTAAPRCEGSRLSCQVVVEPGVDGLTVEVPERQY
jgi:ferredoxin, 2Fe-2S